MKWVPFFIIFLSVVLIYSRSIRGEFLTDDFCIKDMEERFSKFSQSNYVPRFRNILYILLHVPRSVTHFTYHWTWKFFGFREWAWHGFNLAIHLINCAVLYRILMIFHLPHASIAITAFALHPLQVPAVAWISGRAVLLTAMFGYLGWLFLLTEHYPLAVLSQVLAMKSKEDGFLYLAMWPLLG